MSLIYAYPSSPLLDIFTPREKSSPRAKSRSRHRRRCRAAATIPPFSRRRYFVTSKQFGVARSSVCSLTLLFPPPPFFGPGDNNKVEE